MPKSGLSKSFARRSRKNHPGQSPVKLGLLALGILFGLILLGKVFTFMTTLDQPWTVGSGLVASSRWDGYQTVNLVVKTDKLYLLSYNPSVNGALLILIPESSYLEVPHGFNYWPSTSIYSLGQAESPQIGDRLLVDTINRTFSLPIDGYIITESDGQSGSFLESWRGGLLNYLASLWNIQSNLSFRQLWLLTSGIRGVRFDRLEELDLEQSSATKWKVLADGSRVLAIQQAELESLLSGKFEDPLIANEELTLAVFNSTTHPNLAEQVAREITNLGGRVIITANSLANLEQTVVISRNLNSITYKKLVNLYSPVCGKKSLGIIRTLMQQIGVFTKDECAKIISNLQDNPTHADIEVILGEDYFNRVDGRISDL